MARADGAAASELWLSGSVRKDGARDLLSGMISGFFCKILEYPFDTIKVLEQTGGAKYSGPLDAARKAIAESGVWSLYNGLTAPLLGSMAECASLFVAYGMIKNALGVDEEAATLEHNVPMWKYVLAGGGSGCCSTCVLTRTLTLTLTTNPNSNPNPNQVRAHAGRARQVPAAGALSPSLTLTQP